MNSNNSPYKFNAKEYDAETGNYYYGARYYDPKWSIMLSVDQMYDKYPSFSPYAYTLQNPVKYVDPTGMTAESPVMIMGWIKKGI
ncbi:RHS repeat-associated core domain-containing protein [Aequorivita viscosa]|uniref:RHS repeat-associated core domain-containing protein n=1 Tax=Aequorivita viscosa TaxID=797419 RepID=A0A1M6M2D7_9FLAO|nr:RHS repeat-associated core domain-containing protein [Aequorivita viscosa]SDX31233.1 RHS repeat-associated core domain-containing protein [Aequorivita viscosa]SHJ77642.1 RHS repeat-associated core domain-containing protein [Aequorivita viscosa]